MTESLSWADHEYIEKHRIADRYARGQLPADEAQRFEEHYLYCQKCLDDLELNEAMTDGFRQLAASEESGSAKPRGWVLTYPRAAWAAAAVIVLLVLPAAYLTREVDQLSDQLASVLQPQVNPPFIALGLQRSGITDSDTPSALVRLSGSPEWLVFSLDLEPPIAERYGAALVDPNGVEVWSSARLEPGFEDTLRISFHSTFLQPGDYRLEVAPVDGAEGKLLYRFRVR